MSNLRELLNDEATPSAVAVDRIQGPRHEGIRPSNHTASYNVYSESRFEHYEEVKKISRAKVFGKDVL